MRVYARTYAREKKNPRKIAADRISRRRSSGVGVILACARMCAYADTRPPC